MERQVKPRLQFTQDERSTVQPPKPMDGQSAVPSRVPKRKRMEIGRLSNEAAGKTVGRLRFDEPHKAPSKLMHEAAQSAVNSQSEQTEEENSGVDAAHAAKQTVTGSVRLAAFKNRRHSQTRQAAVAPQKSAHSRMQQKRAFKRAYGTKKAAVQTKGVINRAKQGVKRFVTRSKKTYLLIAALFLMIALVMNGLSSCTPLVQGAMQAFVIATYPAEDQDILSAERYYKGLENDLQRELDHYAAAHPQYDAFVFETDEIWHDPHVLISLISAHANGDWTVSGVYGFMDLLFKKQYTLTQKVASETRYRKEWVTHHDKEVDEETGEVKWVDYEVEEEVPYTYRTCTVTLDNFNLSHLPFYVLSREGVGRYAMYISVLGNREDLFRGNPYASTLREPGKHEVPEAYLEDETFRRILEEAEQYVGYPYVWGGDSPETSFDCSGFVSYVFTHSGVRNTGRLGATSLYGACRKITPDEAKPGDLIFFQGTISGEEGITHVGIYVGDGYMLHCGSPIGYANLSDSYWQKHYYGYGRLTQD